jgi:hypothetical protein
VSVSQPLGDQIEEEEEELDEEELEAEAADELDGNYNNDDLVQ